MLVLRQLGGLSGGVLTKILLVDNAVLVDHEGHDTAGCGIAPGRQGRANPPFISPLSLRSSFCHRAQPVLGP